MFLDHYGRYWNRLFRSIFPSYGKKPILVFFFTIMVIPIIPSGAFCDDTYSTEENTDRQGMDNSHFKMNPNDDYSLCAQACMENPECRVYTYVRPGIQGDNPVSWLKNGVPDPKNDICCISGLKSENNQYSTALISTTVFPFSTTDSKAGSYMVSEYFPGISKDQWNNGIIIHWENTCFPPSPYYKKLLVYSTSFQAVVLKGVELGT